MRRFNPLVITRAFLASALLVFAAKSQALDCCIAPGGPVTASVADTLSTGPAYGTVTINGTTTYNAWCLRPDYFIFPASAGYVHPNSLLFSTCDDFIVATLAAVNQPPDLDYNGENGADPAKFRALNWILNNRAGYTAAQVQAAMWIVLYNFSPAGGHGPITGADFLAAAPLANAAKVFAAANPTFDPACGKIGWVLQAPDAVYAGTTYPQQLMLLEVVCECPPACLGDLVWEDLNYDGIQQANEPGVQGVKVDLYDCAGNYLNQTTTTDINGKYSFCNLAPGSYKVKFGLPNGYSYTKSLQGGDVCKDSAGQFSECATLKPGDNYICLDTGIYRPAAIGDYVWIDTNANGQQDEVGTGVPGVRVELYDCNGNLLNSMNTDANGKYLFSGLAPGNYNVKVIVPPIYEVTTRDAGNDASDSDIDAAGNMICTTLVSGETDLTWDAGLKLIPSGPCVTQNIAFSGYTAGCGPLGNIRTFTSGGLSVKVSAFSRVKGAGGAWAPAYVGVYPGGLGVTDGAEGDGSGNKHTVDNVDRLNYLLFEFSEPIEVKRAEAGYVVTDSDMTFWVGNAPDPFNNHITLSDGVLSGLGYTEDDTTVSGSPRWATIDGVAKGNVLVIAAWPGDTTPDDYFKIASLDVCREGTPPPPCLGSISGKIWRDCDPYGSGGGDGVLAGWKVQLSGPASAETTTGPDGSYTFPNLAAGNYTVTVVPPTGYKQVSDPDGNCNHSTVVTVGPCENKTNVKFAYTGTKPGISFTKTADKSSAKCGETITFTYVVTDTGNTCFYGGMSVYDPLFGQVFHQTPVTPGQSFTITKTYVVKQGDTSSSVNTTATAFGDVPDGLGLSNASATSTTAVSITPCSTPPSPPTCLVAKPDCAKVYLCWNSVYGANGYNIKVSTSKYGPYTTVKSGCTDTSFTHYNLKNGEVYYYVVTAVKNGVESNCSNEESVIPSAGLPYVCDTKDIGPVGDEGGASYDWSDEKFTVVGSGADIWNSSDEFRFVYMSAYKDCSVVAKVTSVGNTDPWAKAGVMIRENLTSGSKHASVFVTPANGVAFQWRNSSGGSSGNVNTTGLVAPYWVKIVRSGNTFTAYRSPNGTSWTNMGSQTVYMSDSVYIGLAVTSHNDGALCEATFENVNGTP